jgi:hypothetical protein
LKERPVTETPKLEPLKISCVSTDCEQGLHSFRPKPSAEQRPTTCPVCGTEPNADLAVLRSLDPSRLDDVEAMLRQEFIRYHYWTRRPDDRARERVRRVGFDTLIDGLDAYLTKKIGKPANNWDGQQTPWEGYPIAYGQHATATCCRRCLRYWYGIPSDVALLDTHLEWARLSVERYLLLRREHFEAASDDEA